CRTEGRSLGPYGCARPARPPRRRLRHLDRPRLGGRNALQRDGERSPPGQVFPTPPECSAAERRLPAPRKRALTLACRLLATFLAKRPGVRGRHFIPPSLNWNEKSTPRRDWAALGENRFNVPLMVKEAGRWRLYVSF